MPTSVILMKYTDQGIRDAKRIAERIEQSTKLWESMGGKTLAVYLTMGPYDVVAIGEGPSDEVAAAFLLKLGAAGNVTTTTLKAFSLEEAKSIVARV
jgi:uncharacterized protein with GYD domain